MLGSFIRAKRGIKLFSNVGRDLKRGSLLEGAVERMRDGRSPRDSKICASRSVAQAPFVIFLGKCHLPLGGRLMLEPRSWR